ncbi:hypothetical protein F5B22DRAFT_551282 [Xylaria bambusicola]|uniref:uncharacterized protein n=1 Tax=Xylaria bambusicola TaxID=326684 RepID=UPI002007B73A|nr:uncharacterized protein F5B22DRAFT_551282 [Xylaria bambusicola]KAI0503398.1 hypothetical protein F5B22DRAFT_551282 [Xylaria bambusicola]
MESLSALNLNPPKLDTLPTDILLIILGYLDTARSIAHLGATCKGLCQLISAEGWRVFVRTCFSSLRLPESNSAEEWARLARVLTAQSRDWDRRAFVFHSLTPPETRETRRRNDRRPQTSQSIPGNIIVDAHLQSQGHFDEEFVAWGAGEDVVARIQRKKRKGQATLISEDWHLCKGSENGFVAGKGDTTSISIVKTSPFEDGRDMSVVVGRANGDLRLLSMDHSTFGRTLMRFRPSPASPIHQHEIRAVDVDSSNIIATSTRESVWLYPAQNHDQVQVNDTEDLFIDPITTACLKDSQQLSSFEFIRSMKILNKETLAVALNRSFDPLRVLTVTPTGLDISKPARNLDELPYIDASPRTVRALLPVDVRSIASGYGNVILSSWDDGTIRLQDLRTPSPVDQIYQDNFEVATPINALISHGLERFVAGSAYSHMLKIFDFRWPRGYYHTDSLPCTSSRPYPTPRPPTIIDEPECYHRRSLCNHLFGYRCRWHALSRHDFYRPNCNIYLPFRNYASSPIYSLAKPSDISPVVYAGLSGLLVEFALKSDMHTATVSNQPPLYTRQTGKVAVLETGDGSRILDVSKCQRVPEIRRQSFSGIEGGGITARRQHRLDEALQDPREWQEFKASPI